MDLERIARKCRAMVQSRGKVAAAIRQLRADNTSLRTQVASLSESSCAIEMHWMRSEVSAYQQLRNRIKVIESGFSGEWEELRKERADIQNVVRKAVKKITQDLNSDNARLRSEVSRLRDEMTRLQLVDRRLKATSADLETAQSVAPVWVLADAKPRTNDPISRLRLQ